MGQGKPSSFSSNLRNGGRNLLYTQPVKGSRTFKPSGDPNTDPPYVAAESEDYYARRMSGVDTPAGRDAKDEFFKQRAPAYLKRVLEEGRHWERIRFQVNKSPRARKRALEREARRERRQCDLKKLV
jgi:hypothetical protein